MRVGTCITSAAFGLVGGLVAFWLANFAPSFIPKIETETQATLVTGTWAVCVAISATIIAVWGVISQRAITRRQVTFEQLVSSQVDASFQKAIGVFNRLSSDPQAMAGLAAEDKQGTKEAQAIHAVLADFELYSIGIQKGIIDYGLYHRLNRGYVLYSWKKAEPFIVALRSAAGRRNIYNEFEELADWMSDKKRPRRSFWWAGLF